MIDFCKVQSLAWGTALLGAVSAAWGQTSSPDEARWYVQGSAHQAGSTSAPVTLNMGSGVVLDGQQKLGTGTGASLALGRQFASGDDPQDHSLWRIELEAWTAAMKRQAVLVSPLNLAPHDTVNGNALFLNAGWRLSESDERYGTSTTPLWRTWLMGGVGTASMRLQQPPDAPAGCGCFGAATASGMAYQLKLQVERQISENGWMLFGQLAHVWLPSISTAAASVPQTRYGRFDMGTVSIGLRKLFD